MIGLVYHVLILGVCFAHFDPNVLSNALHMHHITPHAHLSCFLHFNDITCFSIYNMIMFLLGLCVCFYGLNWY